MIFQTQRGQAIPTLAQVEREKRKLDRRYRRRRAALSVLISFLVTIMSGAVLLLLFLPVLEVSGSSMEPTLKDGDILVLSKPGALQSGELCGMYAKGRLILKRIIGLPEKLWAPAICPFPIPCRRTVCSCWGIIGRPVSTAAAASSAVCRRIRSWARWWPGSGPWAASDGWSKRSSLFFI